MRTMWKMACAVAAIVGGTMLSTAQAAMFPYANDFTSTGLENASAEFTLDTANGVLDYVSGGGTVVSTASEPIIGIGTSDFVVSTRFTLNDVQGTGNTMTVGFGAFGSSSAFVSGGGDAFYLADWGVGGGGAQGLRILALGDDSDFSNAGGTAEAGTAGNTFELRLTGTFTGGTLDMSLALFDDVGTQIGTAATATDTSPLTGQFFGYRNRTAGANHVIDVSYDSFSVVPEPSPIVSAVAAMAGLMLLGRKPLRQVD